MQKVITPSTFAFTKTPTTVTNNIYSLLISPQQEMTSTTGTTNNSWNLPKLNQVVQQIQPVEKKMKFTSENIDDHVNIKTSQSQQQLSPPTDHTEYLNSSNGDDQTLPNFKQFELQIKSTTSSTSSSPIHEPFSCNSKDFRLSTNSFDHQSQQQPQPQPQPQQQQQQQGSPYLSYPSSPIDQNNANNFKQQQNERKQIQEWIQELQTLRKRESILLENLKSHNCSDDSDVEQECNSPNLIHENQFSSASSLNSIMNNITTTTIVPTEMIIQQQPPENIVFNRYINPSPILLVDQEIINKSNGYLIVNASLIHRNGKQSTTTSTGSVNKVTKGNQDVLQGVKSIIVEKSGVVLFNKLKVNELLLKKSQSQYFSLYFTLSEITDNQIHPISQIISSTFQFINRNNNNLNKRKFDDIDVFEQEPSSPQSKNSICSSPYSPPSPLIQTNQSSSSIKSFSSSSSSSSSSDSEREQPSQQQQQQQQIQLVNSTPSSSSSSLITKENDSNYIDITELLVLPQKEAAARLGISESMLCKRFKECTKRKWPYRYLKKIDKVIKILSFQNANEMPKDEKEKLERFTNEREECLRPVKIRITGCLEKEDFDFHSPSTNNNNNNNNNNVINTSSQQDLKPSSKSQIQSIINITHPQDDNNINTGENNGLENILETLEMLKHTHH